MGLIIAVVSQYLGICGELGPGFLWIPKPEDAAYVKWHCMVIPLSLWILNPGIQPTGLLSVVGLIC